MSHSSFAAQAKAKPHHRTEQKGKSLLPPWTVLATMGLGVVLIGIIGF